MGKLDFIEAEMQNRRKRHIFRSLRTVLPLSGSKVLIDGRPMLNFCSNDYLGLARHPLLKQRSAEFLERYGAGSTASRLICGSYECFDIVEKKLADLKQTECALLFNSGFQANISVLPALAGPDSLILSDQLNHNSIILGALLARCKKIVFKHNDLADLRRLLKENQDKGFDRILIVSESVFSMDGDRSDIDTLEALAEEFQALLVLDEAHASGVMGKEGMGLSCGRNIDLVIGTFGKACGSFGSYIACSEKLRDYLINCCAGFIYSTALPPSVIGSIDASLDLIPGMKKERLELCRKTDFLRSSLKELNYNTGLSTTQIIPLIVGDERETMALSKWFEKNGIIATAIRPPTVSKGQSRIRLTLSTAHSWKDIEKLVNVIKQWHGTRYNEEVIG